MIHIHAWLYKDLDQNGIYPTIASPNGWQLNNGDKRICRVCGLIQEQSKLFYDEVNWVSRGYAEDKDAVIRAWKDKHLDERLTRKAAQTRRREKIKSNKIPTSELVDAILAKENLV